MTDREWALGWVNRVRKLLGADPLTELPAGQRMSGVACPIARAIPIPRISVGAAVMGAPTKQSVQMDLVRSRMHLRRYTSTWGLSPGRVEVFLPRRVQQFVARFDDGEYPDLNVRTAEGRRTLRRQRMMGGIQPTRRR